VLLDRLYVNQNGQELLVNKARWIKDLNYFQPVFIGTIERLILYYQFLKDKYSTLYTNCFIFMEVDLTLNTFIFIKKKIILCRNNENIL